MHPLHEVMEVLAPRRYSQAVVEAIHEPGLAASHWPPEVHAGRAFTAMHGLEAALQRLNRTALCDIDDEATCQRLLISSQRRLR
mgnify:CR=1 FL=1